MAAGHAQPRFDLYEAVILLDGYLETLRTGLPRSQAVRRVSEDLRRMAVNRGYQIDDSYRNVSGIYKQMLSMESAYSGKSSKVPATVMFKQTVDLYHNDPEQYAKILQEARDMIEPKRNPEEDFLAWLRDHAPAQHLSELYLALHEIEEYAKKRGWIQKSLYEDLRLPTLKALRANLDASKIFKLTHTKQQWYSILQAQKSLYLYATSRAKEESQKTAPGNTLKPTKNNPPAKPSAQGTQVPTKTAPATASPMPAEAQESQEPAKPSTPLRSQDAQGAKEQGDAAPELQPTTRPQSPPTLAQNPLVYTAKDAEPLPVKPPTPEPADTATGPEREESDATKVVDFRNLNLTYTKPLTLSYFGDTRQEVSWRNVFVDACRFLLDDYPVVFEKLAAQGNLEKYTFITDEQHKNKLRREYKLGENCFVETNLSANDHISNLRVILDACRVDYENVVITYYALPVEQNKKEEQAATTPTPVVTKSKQPVDYTNIRNFSNWLKVSQHLAATTCNQYISAIKFAENYAKEHQFKTDKLFTSDVAQAKATAEALLADPQFMELNDKGHGACRAAIAKLLKWMGCEKQDLTIQSMRDGRATQDNVLATFNMGESNLYDYTNKLSFTNWMKVNQHLADRTCYYYSQAIVVAESYAEEHQFKHTQLFTSDVAEANATATELLSDQQFLEKNERKHLLYGAAISQLLRWMSEEENTLTPDSSKLNGQYYPIERDERWFAILKRYFPDGYILNDKLCQLQARAYWKEYYGADCPLQGTEIDSAMLPCGITLDGRVFLKNEECDKLISDIYAEIEKILQHYKSIDLCCIFDRYQDKLAEYSIYTLTAMKKLLTEVAKEHSVAVYEVITAPTKNDTVVQDCMTVLREHGGALPESVITKTLWFISEEKVRHCLSLGNEILYAGKKNWMLAEHFPLTETEVKRIGDTLEEYFLSQGYISQKDLRPLLQNYCPEIAENLTDLSDKAIYSILCYYLKERFTFSPTVISPNGNIKDYATLYRNYSKEHEDFTLDDITAYAHELGAPIYLPALLDAGSVRISATEFVNQKQLAFDVDNTDQVLTKICPGDYMPLKEVASFMLLHLPSCGYPWNGYLLQNYIRNYSKTFKLICISIGKSGYYGAMVKRSCKEINNYNQLVARVLSDDTSWSNTDEALELLVNRGYQAQHRYNGIQEMVDQIKKTRIAEDV